MSFTYLIIFEFLLIFRPNCQLCFVKNHQFFAALFIIILQYVTLLSKPTMLTINYFLQYTIYKRKSELCNCVTLFHPKIPYSVQFLFSKIITSPNKLVLGL